MDAFLTDLHVTDVEGSDEYWELTDPLVYWSKRLRRFVRVPRGFRTNLASIPKVLRGFFSTYGRHSKAAVLHDYLYAAHEASGRPVTRREADDVFRDAMEILGVPALRKNAYHLAVRMFGGGAWARNHTNNGN